MGKKSVGLIGVFLLAILFFMAYVLASHVVKTYDGADSFSFDEGSNNFFNISVNNTDAGVAANITEVNITLPGNFNFISNSNGSDATAEFRNSSSTISWYNASGYVINGSEKKYFWFNASTAVPGSYELVVTTTNATSSYTLNITVEINDTTDPTASFGTNPINYYNSSSANVTFNLKCSDEYGVGTLQLWGNFTGSWAANQTNSSPVNNTYWSKSVSLAEGYYFWGVYCNDSDGNSDWSNSNRTLVVDTTNPTISFSCDDTSVREGETITCTCTGTDALSGVHSTSYTENPSTGTIGSHTTSCTVTDYAGNSVTSSVDYTITRASSSSSLSTITKERSWSSADVKAGETITMNNFYVDYGIKELNIDLKEDAEDVEIVVKIFESKPSSIKQAAPGEAYKFFHVETQNIEGKISQGSIEIGVPKSWLSDNGLSQGDIALYKFYEDSGEWKALETNYEDEDSKFYYYTTPLNSFSYFMIGEYKKTVTKETPEEKTETTSENEEGAETITGKAVDETKSEGKSWWVVLLYIILIAAVLGVAGYIVFNLYKKQKKK